MNWIKENKFLTVFSAVMLIGIGILGYLLFSASGHFDEVSDNYNRQASELKRLQSLVPFPDEANLKKLSDQKLAYIQSLSNLQKSLAGMEYPEQPMTPEQFQDKLRAAVSQAVDKAKGANIELFDKFYLGFQDYQTSLPKPEAAAPLGRQLQAIQLVVNQAFDAKIDKLISISRSPLPEEGVSAAATEASNAKGKAGVAPVKPLVTKSSFDISFRAEQFRFRKWLNDISSAKEQFYIVRLLAVSNDNPKAPSRTEETAAAETGVAADASAAGSPTPSSLKFVVGVEKVNVAAKIDIFDFNPSTTAAK